jgi:hypothetical protein
MPLTPALSHREMEKESPPLSEEGPGVSSHQPQQGDADRDHRQALAQIAGEQEAQEAQAGTHKAYQRQDPEEAAVMLYLPATK